MQWRRIDLGNSDIICHHHYHHVGWCDCVFSHAFVLPSCRAQCQPSCFNFHKSRRFPQVPNPLDANTLEHVFLCYFVHSGDISFCWYYPGHIVGQKHCTNRPQNTRTLGNSRRQKKMFLPPVLSNTSTLRHGLGLGACRKQRISGPIPRWDWSVSL